MAPTAEMLVVDVAPGVTLVVKAAGVAVDFAAYFAGTGTGANFDDGAARGLLKQLGLTSTTVVTYSAWRTAHGL